MQRSRFLTKSRFKLALECPTKLFYTGKTEDYNNQKLDDPFLEALAEGGFQVGELAKLYHPGGVEVREKDHAKAVLETDRLLDNEQVTIFEAAVQQEKLFIRADILVRSGEELSLIEVKAKSVSGADEPFLNKSGAIVPDWKPYLYDVAFQRLVLQKAFPWCRIRSYLMLADKSRVATVDKLNQHFLIKKEKERTVVVVNGPLTPADLGAEILVRINVDPVVNGILYGNLFTERQWLQVEKATRRDPTPFLDVKGLGKEMKSWQYPLHFIDFETSAFAIPFFRDMHPYEGIAFQFSHHTVDEKGRIEHAGQHLEWKPGVFPNFDFVRKLKDELSHDQGTVFRYHNHENTYLNFIYRQLTETPRPVPDKQELLAFIRQITHSSDKQSQAWCGDRDMVDMHQLVRRYYYHPYTRGSNSLKFVLPAALNSSRFLQEKYAQPIYGKGLEIPSLNFERQIWVTWANGRVVDPYKLLPPVFAGVDTTKLENLMTDELAMLAEGGAAMTAWARMQFTEMTGRERGLLRTALLKYCELDTFAMVMLWEYFREHVL